MSKPNEFNALGEHSPEGSYRRGFQQGARAVFQAIKRLLPGEAARQLSEYTESRLHDWRGYSDPSNKNLPPRPPKL